MSGKNQTFFKEFIFVAYSPNFYICLLFFLALLIVYVMTLLGNCLLLCTIITSPKLHTPMYFFLCNLAFIDLCFSSYSVPKILIETFFHTRTISVVGCLAQVNIGLFIGGSECLLMPIMAYDRYIAIRLPLRYVTIMNWRFCRSLAAVVWLGSSFFIIPTIAKPLTFCTENRINHFVCEILGLLEIACGNLHYTKMTMFVEMFFSMVAPLSFILLSYIFIFLSLARIQSNEGRRKAFSTCASHLTAVVLFYGSAMTMYMGQSKTLLLYLKYISLLYGAAPPLLNPIIYSLRNRDVQEGFKYCVLKYYCR